jgi:hypothetical protein
MTDIERGTAMCFRRGCGLPWEDEISVPNYYTRLCRKHKLELARRAEIHGGYSAVNAADSDRRRPYDNPWGWKLREDYHANSDL